LRFDLRGPRRLGWRRRLRLRASLRASLGLWRGGLLRRDEAGRNRGHHRKNA
jgi:hypothetical protein